MRITILANNDLPANYALNLLCESLGSHELSIFLSSRVGKTSNRPDKLVQLQFFEQTLFTELLFPLLKHSGGCKLLGFDGLANKVGRPISVLNSVNEGADFETLIATTPELILTLRYGVILKANVIGIPDYGVINLHSGLLPSYKGVMATFRAMLAGEPTIGTTLHYIRDATIDTGPVIGTTRLSVDPGRSYLWHLLNLYPAACDLVTRTVEEIAESGVVRASAQKTGGRYYSFPTAEDIRAFEEKGCRLFDVSEVLEFARQFVSIPSVVTSSEMTPVVHGH